MKIISTTKRIFRGEVNARTAALEAARRVRVMNMRRREKAGLAELDRQPVRLREEFARVRAADLLAHFHSRARPKFLPGIDDFPVTARIQQEIFPDETNRLIKHARQIADQHCWPLLGFGEKCFGQAEIQWRRDPLSGFVWPLEYHGDISLIRNDGSDARVLWELNRCAHFITLGRAFAITNDEKFSEAFFRQLGSWREQNPVARGVNWSCAMEVALRAMNLLAAFKLFLRAPQMDEIALKEFLRMFDQHGAHIQRNLEFSHIATSNHYLADVVGLLWIGVMLPELEAANEWREFGLRELLSEMDKQVLPDGADYEASTGYHRLKVELFLYSFVLCHLNGFDIGEKYWSKLRGMVDYVRAYIRLDGAAPMNGDSDSGQVLPIVQRRGDDHSYLLALGAAVFQETRFKLRGVRPTEDLLWLLGEKGLWDYESLRDGEAPASQSFPNAGIYPLRADDLYLLFNASDSGVNGRGSHGHNDALSIEVSACGTSFIIDPGSYVYTADLHERHLFRSTAYHSTVEVDRTEQNSIDETMPFIIGNEARPRVLSWETNADADTVVAEHYGYQRLPQPVTHRRTVRFDKHNRFWIVDDQLTGEGAHEFSFRFHLAPGLETKVSDEAIVEVCDKMNGARLLIMCQKPDREGGPVFDAEPKFESQFSSIDYGQKEPSVSICWTMKANLPLKMQFALVPIGMDEDGDEKWHRLQSVINLSNQ
ncbi:MAG: alginate lyase family protein [Pyrinomonadaceae bacterium]